jgi:hypothetical protein
LLRPKTPNATELRHRCARPGYRSIPAARFVTIEKRPTVTRKSRLTTGTGLGHNSKAVHRAYAKRALMKIPSLEDYEQQAAMKAEPTT